MENLKYIGGLKQDKNIAHKKKINWLVKYIVKRPIIFLVYIFVGIAVLFITAMQIKTPIFKTYSGMCILEQEDKIIVNLEKSFQTDGTIYIYTDREKNIWDVNDYEIKDNQLVIHNSPSQLLGKKIYLDVESGKITLLEMIVLGGGN